MENQAALSCVLGHEMGHVLAKHGGQRISDVFFYKSYRLATTPFLLEMMRNQERQADEIGIYLTALAGYDPRECSHFWNRITSFEGNRRDIVNLFISTHPTHPEREEAMRTLGARLEKYYLNRGEMLGKGSEYKL